MSHGRIYGDSALIEKVCTLIYVRRGFLSKPNTLYQQQLLFNFFFFLRVVAKHCKEGGSNDFRAKY